jgi:hypothetical protein
VNKKCVPDRKYVFSPENLSTTLVSSCRIEWRKLQVQALLDKNIGYVFDLASWVANENKLGEV